MFSLFKKKPPEPKTGIAAGIPLCDLSPKEIKRVTKVLKAFAEGKKLKTTFTYKS